MSSEKTKNMILYICEQSKRYPGFGATKLNKALWFSDLTHFMLNGSYISDFTYVKQGNGPTPKPSMFLPLRRELIEEDKMEIKETHTIGYVWKKPIAKTHADTSLFTEQELDIIDDTIDTIKHMTASDLSDLTHNMGWKKTGIMEEMTAKQFLASNEQLDEIELEFFKKRIA